MMASSENGNSTSAAEPSVSVSVETSAETLLEKVKRTAARKAVENLIFIELKVLPVSVNVWFD